MTHEPEPRPRRGRIFVVLAEAKEFQTESGVIAERENPDQHTRRVEVIALGPMPIEDGVEIPYDFEEGDQLLVPYYAGQTYDSFNPIGFVERLWIINEAEAIAVYKKRKKKEKNDGKKRSAKRSRDS